MAEPYYHPESGEWVMPPMQDFKLGCCDCGLVHKMNFKIANGRVLFQVFRDNRSTGQIRRWARWRHRNCSHG